MNSLTHENCSYRRVRCNKNIFQIIRNINWEPLSKEILIGNNSLRIFSILFCTISVEVPAEAKILGNFFQYVLSLWSYLVPVLPVLVSSSSYTVELVKVLAGWPGTMVIKKWFCTIMTWRIKFRMFQHIVALQISSFDEYSQFKAG